MIKATRKPLERIVGMASGYTRLLVVGCGGCTSVCLAGGQREAIELADELEAQARGAPAPRRCGVAVAERQCNPEFLAELEDRISEVDCLVSMACGAGAGELADAFPSLPVVPALDTMFLGIDRDVGYYEERCRTCGDCQLGETGGICPVTRCSKSLMNGPCGGTREDGSCELADGIRCAWNDIYDRLKAQGRLEKMLGLRPPMDWQDRGPRALVQRGYEGRYPEAKAKGAGR